MPFKYNFILLFGLVFIFNSCGSDEVADDLYSELPEYQLEIVETLADQGDMILGRPVYTEIDSEGNRLVMDLSTFQIRVYDTEGVYQNSFGREGSGPGEFQQPRSPMISDGDTLYISDHTRRSMIVYHKSGEYTWRHAYDIAFPAVEGGFPFFSLMPSEAGYPVVYRMNEESEEFPHGYSAIILVNRSGAVIEDSGVKFRTGDTINLTMNGNRISFGFSELHNTQIAANRDGTYYQAWTTKPAINQYSASGELLRTIELEGYPIQPVTNDAISAWNERFGGQFGDLSSELRNKIGDHFPAFSQIMTMKDHSIWLRKITPETNQESWYHLSPDGEPLGRLSLESGFSLRNATGEYVYLSGSLDDESPAIIKYALNPSSD